jgi:hypothetical protein
MTPAPDEDPEAILRAMSPLFKPLSDAELAKRRRMRDQAAGDTDGCCPAWPDCPHWEDRKWEFYVDEAGYG